jgi:nitroimidazol reductase NimA-like FMN-containing flavoprotein (pyridoxamine 5'-phosphate oxidase superfamily)
MTDHELRTGLERLDPDACLELLKTQPVGRLAAVIGGRPEIFPMNFTVSEGAVVMRSEDGTKLAAVEGGEVAFEVDAVTEAFRGGWSVIVHGRLERLEDPVDVQRAELTGLRAWSQSGKPHWLRLAAAEVTGRRIVHGADTYAD